MPDPRAEVRAAARHLGVKLFQRVNPGDITIRHHWTGEPFHLHSFKHKGYWYQAASRERPTMIAFAQLVSPGDSVVEVGGHIGYIACWLARLVGERGRLLVCEPGQGNLPYLRRNLADKSWASIHDVALSDSVGEREFMEEEFTGQNNSLRTSSGQFQQTMELNRMHVHANIRMVHTETLDNLIIQRKLSPTLLKIDVEGAELEVLRGAARTLAVDRPAVIVEVGFDHDQVDHLLAEAGYVVLDANFRDVGPMRGFNLMNYIALHRDRHETLLRSLGGV